MITKPSKYTLFLLFILIFNTSTTLFSQESEQVVTATPGRWETHIGFGMSVGASGLPSQVSNKLAEKEGFLADVGSMRGLPLGADFFTGFGYRFGETNHSMGFEFGVGFHNDGGAARVTLGDDPSNIPGYVFDGSIGNSGSEFGVAFFTPIFAMYPGLSTVNTMKGQYLDPKLRVYYRYRRPTWNIQTGLGVKMLIPLNYFAYPSKVFSDYEHQDDTGTFDGSWGAANTQGAIRAARIPFPLKTRDGKVMMRAMQPLLDLHVRAAYRNYYLQVSYSTEFHYIHHVKIGLGIQFM